MLWGFRAPKPRSAQAPRLLTSHSRTTHPSLIGVTDADVMTTPTDPRTASRLEVVWAIVLLQGAILLMVTLESLVANAVFGFVLIANLALTAGAAVLTLVSARGLRRRRRWARRTTMLGESFLIVLGGFDVVATLILAGTLPGLVPLVVTIGAPIAVLALMRGSKPVFSPPDGPAHGGQAEPAGRPMPVPADDPVLGTLLG